MSHDSRTTDRWELKREHSLPASRWSVERSEEFNKNVSSLFDFRFVSETRGSTAEEEEEEGRNEGRLN